MSALQTQALVIGGGPLALLTALALHQRGVDVLLSGEATPLNPPPNPELMLVGGDDMLAPLYQHSLECWRNAAHHFGVEIPLTLTEASDLATTLGRAEKLRAEAMLDALGGETVTYHESPSPWSQASLGHKHWAEAPMLPPDLLARLFVAVKQANIKQQAMNPASLSIIDLNHPQLTLENGSTVQARHIIFTSARALRRVLPPLGLALPLRPARGHVMGLQTAQPHGLPLLLQRLERGHLFLVPTAPREVSLYYDGMNDPAQATFNINPNSQLISALQQHVARLVPVLAGAVLTRCATLQEWLTPDFLPALGPWPGLPGVVVGVGWGGRATAYAAGAAHTLAEHVASGSMGINIQSLEPNRFASGMWQVVRQPGSLSWQEPTQNAPSMLSPKPEYMTNVNMTEAPKAQYASKVQHIEKTIVESAARRAVVKTKERPKIQTASIKP